MLGNEGDYDWTCRAFHVCVCYAVLGDCYEVQTFLCATKSAMPSIGRLLWGEDISVCYQKWQKFWRTPGIVQWPIHNLCYDPSLARRNSFVTSKFLCVCVCLECPSTANPILYYCYVSGCTQHCTFATCVYQCIPNIIPFIHVSIKQCDPAF